MERKLTAVQWLIENAKGFHNAESSKAMQKEALQMGKEQIINAWIATDNQLQRLAAEEYYNQTYNQNK
jgi:hypothetical protein